VLEAHGETLVTEFGIERHQHKAASALKDTVRPDSVIPTNRWMETLPGDRVAMTDQNTSPPISTLDYATASREEIVVFLRSELSQTRMRPQEQALDQDAVKQVDE
jgi:hypothetical protein